MRVVEGKAEIEYPTEWKYKVIGESENRLREAIDEILEKREYELKHSNRSKTGKFISLQASLIVESEKDRDTIFIKLKSHTEVKIVI